MHEQRIRPYHLSDAWLIAASSHLIDRFVPACEQIRLPAKEVEGGVLRFGLGPLPEHAEGRGRLARLRQPRRPRSAAPQGAVFDLRRNVPQNWAHFLNNHLPIVFRVCDQLEIDPDKAVLVTPEATPGYIARAAELFGLTLVATDDVLQGEGVLYDAEPWTGIRPERADWVRGAHVARVLARLDAAPEALPARVFLSRRDTRTLQNEAAVSGWLAERGFVTVYPEDLSAADQLRLFRRAEVMVAIHGAGLAPLLYAQPGGQLRHLVELLPCGHMTDVYRVMAEQLGCGWIGVRGRIKPEYVAPAYDFSAKFAKFSLDSFDIDLAALEIAFGMAGL